MRIVIYKDEDASGRWRWVLAVNTGRFLIPREFGTWRWCRDHVDRAIADIKLILAR